MTPPNDLSIVRAACWITLVLVLLSMMVVLDVWRIKRAAGVADWRDRCVVLVVGVALMAIGAMFSRGSWTGCLP